MYSYSELEKILSSKKINKSTLSATLGISSKTIAKISKGEKISNRVLEKIANYLSCDASNICRKVSDNFITQMLTDEKNAKVSGGLYHELQIRMTYNSNHMEGSKLSEDQTNEISAVESNSMYQGAQKTDKIANIVRADNTYAYERSLTTGEVVDEQGISVSQLYTEVLRDVNRAQTIEEKVETFNNYLYRYNVDPGIINAQFDYVVGTKTSPMVESFTNAVRELYDDGNGEVGSMTMVYEDNSSYKGYHIIIYTGVLDNAFDSISESNNLNSNNIYNMLGRQYTSLSYNETMFEFIYDKVAKDSFSTYKTELVSSLINGKTTEYITSNYKDLYAN